MNSNKNKLSAMAAALVMSVVISVTPAKAENMDDTIRTAQALFVNMTTKPLLPSNPQFNAIIQKVLAGDMRGAAQIIDNPITGDSDFYNITIANLALTMNLNSTSVSEPTELMGLFLAYARDNLPIKEILYTNRVAFDPTITGGNAYTQNNTAHFQFVFSMGNPRDALKVDARPGTAGIGLWTTNQWATDFLSAGTNRRMYKAMVNHLYGVDITRVKNFDIPSVLVLRDVPRTIGGNSIQFTTNCQGCHSRMDGITTAFARLDFVKNALVFKSPPSQKLNEINGDSFIPNGDSWTWFVEPGDKTFYLHDVGGLTAQTYGDTGLKMYVGAGVEQLGMLIGASDGFYQTLVKRLVAEIWMKKAYSFAEFSDADQATLATQDSQIQTFAAALKTSQNLRQAAEDVAIYYAQMVH